MKEPANQGEAMEFFTQRKLNFQQQSQAANMFRAGASPELVRKLLGMPPANTFSSPVQSPTLVLAPKMPQTLEINSVIEKINPNQIKQDSLGLLRISQEEKRIKQDSSGIPKTNALPTQIPNPKAPPEKQNFQSSLDEMKEYLHRLFQDESKLKLWQKTFQAARYLMNQGITSQQEAEIVLASAGIVDQAIVLETLAKKFKVRTCDNKFEIAARYTLMIHADFQDRYTQNLNPTLKKTLILARCLKGLAKGTKQLIPVILPTTKLGDFLGGLSFQSAANILNILSGMKLIRKVKAATFSDQQAAIYSVRPAKILIPKHFYQGNS